MLSFGAPAGIYVVCGATDLRRGFDTLAAMASNELGRDPLSGEVFAFTNRRRDRVKLLFWDGSGYVLVTKRLERGTFAWPDAPTPSVELRPEELSLLLSGLDLGQTRRRRWFRREVTSTRTKREPEDLAVAASYSS
jgi:transposase